MDNNMKRLIETVVPVVLVLFMTSLNSRAQWVQTNGPYGGDIRSLAYSGQNLFAGTGGGGVFLSTNNGAAWSRVDSGLSTTNLFVNALAFSGTNIFAGIGSSGIFRSTNNGVSWVAVNSGLNQMGVGSFATNGTNLFAGTGGGVFLSTNDGVSWTVASSGFGNVMALTSIGSTLLAGAFSYGVFVSTDSGANWTTINNGLTNLNVRCLAFNGTKVFVGTDGGGVFYLSDTGWTAVITGLADLNVRCLAVNGTAVFAGTSGGVFQLNGTDTSWTAINYGLTNYGIRSITVSDANLFIGCLDSTVWRRSLSELTAVNEGIISLPHGHSLEQNYPNPFNPSTTIRFGLPSRSHVKLSVFNILGQLVATLVDGDIDAGYHEVNFDGRHIASGVYFYRLSVGDPSGSSGWHFVQTRKLVLVR
jgi:hypothetical protein